MKAIIIAAGYATRMYPLTFNKPKSLLDIGGKPMIEYIIEKIEDIKQIDEIIIISNNRFYDQFLEWYKENKGKFSKRILILNERSNNETERRGTVGAFIYGLEESNIEDDLLVLNSDNLFDFSLNGAIAMFNEKKSIVNGVFFEKDKEKIKRHGVVKLSGSRIIAFEEKPENPESDIKSIGIYIFPKEKISKIHEYKKSGKDLDKIGNLIKHFCENDEVYGYLFQGKIYDIGTIETYNEVNKNWNIKMNEEFKDYYLTLIKFLNELSLEQVGKVLDLLRVAKLNKNNIYIVGNGGSAATAEHYANDFLKLSKLRVFALTNLPTITAFGNDVSYDAIFSEQLKVLLNNNDLVIGITGSGNSMNVVNALKYAKENGGKTIGILGFDGGKAKEFCDAYVLVPSRDYGIIEDVHMTLSHYLSRRLKE